MDDIIIVKDATPRGSWKLAKIVELNVRSDRLVRSAVIKLGSGQNIVRPLCLLYPLECSVQKPFPLNKMTLRMTLSKSNRKAMHRNWSNQKANPALETKTGNK